MINIHTKEDCCGCGACGNVCPKGAISIKADEMGFEYAVVNNDLCVSCGACVKTCPVIQKKSATPSHASPKIYAVKHKDRCVLKQSTSGGAFSALAEYIFEKGGSVYGAAFNGDLQVAHIRITSANELSRLRGSKYVQSHMDGIYTAIKNDLENGAHVLFTGTPCQADGVKRFLKNKGAPDDRLLICDLICHGVPSPKIWADYVSYLQTKTKRRLKNYFFRTKIAGWHVRLPKAVYEDGTEEYNTPATTVLSSLYSQSHSVRPSCFACPYTDFNRPSDITIADFWGIERLYPRFDDNRGASLVLVNSQKGAEAFEFVKSRAEFIECRERDCIEQSALYRPCVKKESYDAFWDAYSSKGFEYIAEHYNLYSASGALLKRVYTALDKMRLFSRLYNWKSRRKGSSDGF